MKKALNINKWFLMKPAGLYIIGITHVFSCINICMVPRKLLAGLQIRVRFGKLFSLFLIQNICCGYSKESSQ